MGKVRTKSLKSSMTATFLITICVIGVLSAITIFAANLLQQEILNKRYLTINSPDFQMDEDTENYFFNIDNNSIMWKPLDTRDNIAYYGLYVAMIGYLFFILRLVLELLQKYITERNFGSLLYSCKMEWKRYSKIILIFTLSTVEMTS